MAGAVTGPGLSAKLMEATNPWVPLWVTGGIAPLIFLSTVCLPETRSRQLAPRSNSYEDGSVPATIKTHIRHARERFHESLAVLRGRSIFILLSIFFVHSSIIISHGQIIAQTISKRFHWTLAQTGYMFSIKGILTVLVLALMPFLTSFLTSPRLGKYQLPVFKRELRLIQLSLVFIVIGSALMGGGTLAEVVTGLAISTFAIGIDSFAKSLIASYVDKEHTSRLYALTGMTETAGRFFAGPSLAWAFDRGVKLGWMGLPFFYVAALCTLPLIATCFIRHPDASKDDEETAQEI